MASVADLGAQPSDPTVMAPGDSSPLPTARRRDIHEDGRETLAILRGCNQTINVVLVALTDGVELVVWADGRLRRRSRYLRDTQARKQSQRLAARLARRGYRRGVEVGS
jgi:hypothetical protein